MMQIRKANERGHADHGWLDTYHTFSFADYYDPKHMGFRSLRVINEDVVTGGGGFGTHPHRDMEIITYILSGALEHKDSMGNGRVVRPGEVQYMAAGTGVKHSEFNQSPIEPVHLLQIWIVPDKHGAKPAYADKSFASAPQNTLNLIASKSGRDGSIPINQDANVYFAKLGAGGKLQHSLGMGRAAWIQVARGQLVVNGEKLGAGDGASIESEAQVSLSGTSDSELLLFDLA